MEQDLTHIFCSLHCLDMHQPAAMTTQKYSLLLVALIAFSLRGGYMAATQPPDAGWRFFSWHPFLMTLGMVGLAGIGSVTKKLGGYTNTKVNIIRILKRLPRLKKQLCSCKHQRLYFPLTSCTGSSAGLPLSYPLPVFTVYIATKKTMATNT